MDLTSGPETSSIQVNVILNREEGPHLNDYIVETTIGKYK